MPSLRQWNREIIAGWNCQLLEFVGDVNLLDKNIDSFPLKNTENPLGNIILYIHVSSAF